MKFDSPVAKFPGHVELPDYLNIFQVRAFEDSLDGLQMPEGEAEQERRIWISVGDEKRLPVILACVKEWQIEGVPEHPTLETFPMTPLNEAHELISAIYGEIMRMWMGETVPNV